MRLKYKLLLISIVFLGFVVFNNSNSYAYTYTSKPLSVTNNGVRYESFTIEATIDDEILEKYKYVFCTFEFYGVIRDNNPTYLVFPHLFVSNNEFNIANNNNYYYYGNDFMRAFTEGVIKSHETTSVTFNSESFEYSQLVDSCFTANNYAHLPFFSTFDLYRQNGELYFAKTYDNSFYVPDEDKINLYELNLTDMDYDNQEHLFNICTYTSSPCYDEIMDCYNRDLRYAIFVDDYTRTLTYGEENNDSSFMYGSYMLSGHIDYLMEDSAFFYFDERTKSVKSNSGRLRDGSLQLFTNEEAYTKRFYFNLVYSEDSNDPDQVIWSDNGDLALGEFEENDNPLCFVGSSHNIRYSHYKRLASSSWLPETNFLQLDDSYYYVGYMGSSVHRDITTVPFYHYDFYFYGGTTKLFFTNSSTFQEDKKKRYDELADNYSKNKGKRQEDSSDGGSGIKGKGSSSSTYDRDKITEDSTQDDLDDNSDGYRGTEKTDRDGADKDEDDADRTGFHFLNTLNKIKDKFNFVGNITKNANDIKDFVENTQETHKYYVNINHKYLNGNVCIIDLSWYSPYKETVDAFICAFAYLAFIWHMFCKIPDLIHGASATTYVSDISSYINKR